MALICCSRMHTCPPLFVLMSAVVITVSSSSTERPKANQSPSNSALLLFTIHGNKRIAASLGKSKAVAQEGETPPKPLPQIMLPRNMTADALKPPLGAAQVEPPPKRLVDVDVCKGYYDVMGQFDLTFNCSKDDFIYCCGTCHYRFCCQHRSQRLDQKLCNNYFSPVWANTPPPVTIPLDHRTDPDVDPMRQQTNNTVYVIGGVISFTVAVAVGIKVAFHKASRRPRHREINMPRALVDILRHHSSPVQQGDRNNSVALGSGGNEGTLGRPPKNLYTPGMQSKDNRFGNLHHNFIHHSGSSPKHTATIERVPRMNNAQLGSSGTLLPSKHNNASTAHPSFHHSLHNLAQLPPSYEAAMKPEINRYSSLKRLEKDLDDYSGYYTSKRRPNNAPPSFHSSQHHLHWGGDYTLGARGTLPLHTSRPRSHTPSGPVPTPNPYPLAPPQSQYGPNLDTLSKPPRRVMSQEQLLTAGDGSTLSRLSKNQQHQFYKAMAAAKSSNTQTLKKSQERLLMSPDRLGEDIGGGAVMGDFGGVTPTLPRLTQHQKAQSQQNVCATPSLDRHHMIKMNSHPTSGREQERNMAMPGHVPPPPVGWAEVPGAGAGTLGHSARRMAFATKRQNTIEQLHFIPGGGSAGGGAGGGGNQGLRTGSKNEVTV